MDGPTTSPLPTLLRLVADRNSVCAGDDTDSHARSFAVPGNVSVPELIRVATAVCPLASIWGGLATWVAEAGGRGGRPIAVIAQQWDRPRLLVRDGTTAGDVFVAQVPELFFRYDAQTDPEAVFDALARGEPVPGRRV